MQIVIPAAGQGTRLYPQTRTKPKRMIRVAGKPILGRNATVDEANLRHSIVGDNATVTGTPNELNVGDSSDIHL